MVGSARRRPSLAASRGIATHGKALDVRHGRADVAEEAAEKDGVTVGRTETTRGLLKTGRRQAGGVGRARCRYAVGRGCRRCGSHAVGFRRPAMSQPSSFESQHDASVAQRNTLLIVVVAAVSRLARTAAADPARALCAEGRPAHVEASRERVRPGCTGRRQDACVREGSRRERRVRMSPRSGSGRRRTG